MCGEAYLALRRHAGNLKKTTTMFPKEKQFQLCYADLLITLFTMMLPTGIAELQVKFLEFKLLYSHENT